ncbi:MAG: FAD-dependent oxidoreductase [Proteobacteria bacterium]|nr:FAD-dependent oxidoreductase [Pseudomonadota bacterium]
MKSNTRAVVIGGGVVGVSTLYHLARKGWSDVMLFERNELTSGSTWHAAGLLPLFNMSYSVGQVHKYSVKLYKELEAETGLNSGLSAVGNIRLAMTEDRMDEYRQYAAVAATIGVDVKFLTPEQVKEMWPLCSTEGLVGAIVHPEDGYIQPSDLTFALAKGAKNRGAEIHTQTRVVGIERKGGQWVVNVTDKKGDAHAVTCDHVICASGNFARQTGKMVGLDIPVIPVQHQYIVTGEIPELMERRAQGLPEMGVLRESDGSWYMREERGGLILGPYEKGAPACYVDGPAENAERELFDGDIERLMPHIESAIRRVPCFEKGGVKEVYNGAICYTPDGSPIIGPAWDLPNFWINEGHSFGITAAGGAGWQLAEWIVDGEPTIDMLGIEPRRFGDYAGEAFLITKNEESYANVFTIHYPDEERAAARPLRQAPCYDRLKSKGAVFGQKFGWERANWFAPAGVEAVDDWSFRRSKWFEHVGNEARHVAEHVGVLDMSAFAKCRISGPGARQFLDGVLANKLPAKDGRIALCHGLNSRGGVHSEFTVYKESDDSYYLVSAGAWQRLDHDWLKKQMPTDRSVDFHNITNQRGVLVLSGPKSRELMQRVSPRTDYSNKAFPWLSGQWVDIGLASCLAIRVNFVGELGWELHHPIELQNHIFDALFAAGEELNLKPFGIRAMDALRIEKSYKLIGQELSIEYAAFESGLQRFVHPDKGDFVGKDALLAWQKKGFANQSITLEIHDVTDADPLGNNAIFNQDGEMIGRATSGNYGFRVQKSLALAMVQPQYATVGTELEIDVLGTRHRATVIEESPYDPKNEKLRA